MGFQVQEGYLTCEHVKVKDMQNRISESPFYLYSLKQIKENYHAYITALKGIPSIVAYAFKANNNLTILKHLQKLGSGAVLVSGNELKLAQTAGFDSQRIVFNGNGKTNDELNLAVQNGVMVNIDSEFDLQHIRHAAETVGKPVDVLIRINPDIDAEVHPYLSTALRDSKFGIRNNHLNYFLKKIRSSDLLNLVGVHCHLGTTIKKIDVFRDAALFMIKVIEIIRNERFDIRYLNLGGGLGIDYERTESVPSQFDLINSIRDLITDDIFLIIEPGRSIVGNAGILVTKVIGVKTSEKKNFIVVDGSMTELIRPALYGAYHHVDFIEPVDGEVRTYDVVGPVCESTDFLAKDRSLPTPHEGAGLVVYDAGAYGYAMSSNYNVRMRPPEYLIDGERVIRIRRAETFEDFMRLFEID
ncbi:diaminopimelate decarboxylase, partial [bacterium]|nr:diaminopimelate decarboxylase [bacterium]